MEGIKVLSVFDGISCGRIALERACIPVALYEAYEINPFAIEVSKKNYPDIIQRGDVTSADFSIHKDIDLLIGGSPCQGLSNANVYLKNGEYGVSGSGTSSLFWYYVSALRQTNPKYFFFENVASMKKEDKNIITRELGVPPVEINSVLFSGQIRRRLYWTNIPFTVPTERVVSTRLCDVLEKTVADRYYLKQGTLEYVMSSGTGNWRSGNRVINPEFGRPVVASCWKIHRADTDSYVSTEYQPKGRTNVRRLLPIEVERLQTLPDNYTLIEDGRSLPKSDRHRWEMIGNGWCVDTVAHIFKGLPYVSQ